MLFSVIIPVYNCKAFLAGTVDQVRNAGLWDYEILLIDDGSTDGTAQICDALAEAYGEVRCIHQCNAGVSAARNRGIMEAQGEYILFFDADDGVDNGALHHAAHIIQQEKPDLLAYGLSFDYYFRNRLYRREPLVYPAGGHMNRAQLAESFEELYQYNVISPVWNKLIRKDILTDHNIRFASGLIEMEDFVFSVDCLCACESVYLLPEAVYRYRQSVAERNTYNRLCRISSLTAYMEPFQECIGKWLKISGRQGAALDMTGRIYTMFLMERMRYASPKAISEVAQDMIGSIYDEAVKANASEIYDMLINRRFYSVWLRNMKSRIRHWLAVRVKYLRSFRRKP